MEIMHINALINYKSINVHIHFHKFKLFSLTIHTARFQGNWYYGLFPDIVFILLPWRFKAVNAIFLYKSIQNLKLTGYPCTHFLEIIRSLRPFKDHKGIILDIPLLLKGAKYEWKRHFTEAAQFPKLSHIAAFFNIPTENTSKSRFSVMHSNNRICLYENRVFPRIGYKEASQTSRWPANWFELGCKMADTTPSLGKKQQSELRGTVVKKWMKSNDEDENGDKAVMKMSSKICWVKGRSMDRINAHPGSVSLSP
jgi:hypothetical protein